MFQQPDNAIRASLSAANDADLLKFRRLQWQIVWGQAGDAVSDLIFACMRGGNIGREIVREDFFLSDLNRVLFPRQRRPDAAILFIPGEREECDTPRG